MSLSGSGGGRPNWLRLIEGYWGIVSRGNGGGWINKGTLTKILWSDYLTNMEILAEIKPLGDYIQNALIEKWWIFAILAALIVFKVVSFFRNNK